MVDFRIFRNDRKGADSRVRDSGLNHSTIIDKDDDTNESYYTDATKATRT